MVKEYGELGKGFVVGLRLFGAGILVIGILLGVIGHIFLGWLFSHFFIGWQ